MHVHVACIFPCPNPTLGDGSDASDDDKPYLVAYAESKDGRTFTKPPLHQYPLPGSGSTNSIIGPGLSLPEHEGCSVWVDEKRALGGKYVSQGKMPGKGCAPGATHGSAGTGGDRGTMDTSIIPAGSSMRGRSRKARQTQWSNA